MTREKAFSIAKRVRPLSARSLEDGYKNARGAWVFSDMWVVILVEPDGTYLDLSSA